jgi:predicted nucleic-acid-binding protein
MNHDSVSLDTSFMLRLLVSQPLEQFHLASAFMAEQRASDVPIHASDLVLAEAYYALQAFYQLPKADAIAAISSFVRHSGVTVSQSASETLALPDLASTKPGFVDRLIHGESQAAGRTLVTFEKAAKKLAGTLVLSAS